MEVREKTKWGLTPGAFDKLLASLDPDRERAGEKYEQVRDGLVCFFEWRGGPSPEDHADETLNRVARKLDEGGTVDDPLTYVYGVARMLLLEIHKRRARERVALADLAAASRPPPPDAEEEALAQLRLDCLRRCLGELPREGRDLITAYYQGEKRAKIDNRKRLAEQLGIPLNALRLRARRLWAALEECVGGCVKGGR
jgi:DNA-directed RNA polymerase specialized sigma24 family protein